MPRRTSRRRSREGERDPDLAERDRHRQSDLAERVDLDAARQQHERGAEHDRQGEDAAEREPEEHVRPLLAEVLAVHFSSTPPEEKKNTSYGVIAAPNKAIA